MPLKPNVNQPKQIGVYPIQKVLGCGISGSVYLSQDEDGVEVAIKSMDMSKLTYTSCEVKSMKSYSPHPNLIRLIKEIKDNNWVHLVINYAGKDNILTYINREGGLEESEARRVFRSMLSGLNHLHQAGYIHRDIKCENIILSPDLVPVICDLGFAGRWNPGQYISVYCGSFHYISPEILDEIPYIGPEIDIWALGVVLYALVARQLPWDGNQEEMAECIRTGDYWVVEHFSEDFYELLDNILNPDPEERWTYSEIKQSNWYRTTSGGIKVSASMASTVSINSAFGRQSGRSVFSSLMPNGPERINQSGRIMPKELENLEGEISSALEIEPKIELPLPQTNTTSTTYPHKSLKSGSLDDINNLLSKLSTQSQNNGSQQRIMSPRWSADLNELIRKQTESPKQSKFKEIVTKLRHPKNSQKRKDSPPKLASNSSSKFTKLTSRGRGFLSGTPKNRSPSLSSLPAHMDPSAPMVSVCRIDTS